MPPWFATLDGYAILASANFGFAQDDTLSACSEATLTLASPVRKGGLLGAAKALNFKLLFFALLKICLSS